MISKPGNKTAASQWPCPQSVAHSYNTRNLLICRSGANSTSSAKLYQPFLTTKICHSFVSQTNCIDVHTISMKHLISRVRWCSQQPILCLRNMRTSAVSGDRHALWEVTISPAEETHVHWEHLFPTHKTRRARDARRGSSLWCVFHHMRGLSVSGMQGNKSQVLTSCSAPWSRDALVAGSTLAIKKSLKMSSIAL